MDKRETVVDWLRDAHAMEAAAIENLERNISRFDGYPAVQIKFREDIGYSKRHLAEIERCLDRMGADRSMLKDMAMKFAGVMQPYVTGTAADEVVKHLLAAQAYESFEIASYRSLAAAADQIGEPEIKRVCEESIQHKREMADWIDRELPAVTRDYLSTKH